MTLSDSGEALVDIEARLQELMDERAVTRRRGAALTTPDDPERAREKESWRLARAELQRQFGATRHPVRREQIAQAIAELDRRLGLA